MPKKKWTQKNRVLAIFSCWMVLYGPKKCCMIRAYCCAALDTPLAYIWKKIDPRPPGAQKRAKKALLGPSTEKSECMAAKALKLRSFWHQPISGSSFGSRTKEFLPVASGPKISIFFTLHPYNPHFLGSDGSDQMGSKVPHILDNFSFPVCGRSAGRFPATGPNFGQKIRFWL